MTETPNQSRSLALTLAGLTDTGRMRGRNEDCFAIHADLGLALVCDGMGGHAGGDVASRTAADAVAALVREFLGGTAGPEETATLRAGAAVTRPGGAGEGMVEGAVRAAMAIVRSAVQLASRRLLGLNQQNGYSDGRGMGTTVVGLWRIGASDALVVFHAGDSRLYRWRDGVLAALTRDHSLHQAWQDAGRRGPEPNRNIILRALGVQPDLEPELSLHRIRPGDVYLLCSDGLNGMLADGEIAAVLRDQGLADPEGACVRLVASANAAGGCDNITVVVAGVTAPS